MGTKIVVDGYAIPVHSYSITEDSTPLAAGDTSGGTGLLSVDLLEPDAYLEMTQDTGMKWLRDKGRNVLLDKIISFTDTRWGSLSGRVTSAQRSGRGTIQISCMTDLNQLNAYNVQSQPYDGTLGGLLTYYTSLASLPAPTVDGALASRPISVPGWTGELWYHLKMLAVAQNFEIALVDGDIVVRQLRQRDIRKGMETANGGGTPVPTLAQSVEVYQYNNLAITDELVYPPGGWTPDVEVLNVNAGEIVEYTINLSASVSSIVTPTMEEFVDPAESSASVYTIVANDGLPVTPAMWDARGGVLKVRINPDTRSLTVRMRGATKIPLATGGEASNFSVALGSDATGSRYSTLRILGTGVSFDKQKKTFRTGVTPQQSGTEVGVTIDNLFLSDKNQTYRAGVRAAVAYAGPVPTLNTSVTQAFPTGETTLGRLNGSRTVDPETARPYRVRTASVDPSGVSLTYEDDLLHDDQEAFRLGRTYLEVEGDRDGLTYRDDYLIGLR